MFEIVDGSQTKGTVSMRGFAEEGTKFWKEDEIAVARQSFEVVGMVLENGVHRVRLAPK